MEKYMKLGVGIIFYLLKSFFKVKKKEKNICSFTQKIIQ